MPLVTDGGKGTGVEALGTHYPFVDPSDDVAGLLSDLHLVHEVQSVVPPLHLAWVYGLCDAQSSCSSGSSLRSESLTPAHEADILIKDASGAIIFNSIEAAYFASRVWSSRFKIYEWRSDDATCLLVAHRGYGEPDQVKIFDLEIIPENGVLDERTWELRPRYVKSIKVGSEIFSTESLELSGGYNTSLAQTAVRQDGLRNRQRVVMRMSPGSGEGRYVACQPPEVVIRRINNQGPDPNGNFSLSGTGCYWTEKSATFSSPPSDAFLEQASLQLHNDCEPCCKCSDFENMYLALRRVYEELKALGDRATAARDLHEENIQKWKQEQACRKNNPLRVQATASSGGTLDVFTALASEDCDCKFEVKQEFAISHNRDEMGTIATGSVFISNGEGVMEESSLGGSWPNYEAFLEILKARKAMKVRFRLVFDEAIEGDSVTLTVTPSFGGTPRQSVEITRSLKV